MAEQKKEIVIDTDTIDKDLKGFGKDKDKQIKYLKDLYQKKGYEKLKQHIVKQLVPLLLDKPVAENKLVYDSIGEGIEPIYFWILDFINENPPGGLGMQVKKLDEAFEASASSAYFGEMGARATQMQQKAAEYLGAINQVVKSIVNLLYDLKEFEIRISEYDKLKSTKDSERDEADQVLKTIWMDQVDIKKGRGSINGLAQDLRFITLRDAFFVVKTSSDVDKKELDLNDRVKRILKTKLEEFIDWKRASESEIRKRYGVERAYLKSQIGSLDLYISWVKPYIKNARKLAMSEFKDKDANMIESFSNMHTKLSLCGFKEVKPDKVHASYKDIKLPDEKRIYSVIDIEMYFRTVPQALQGQNGRHYIQGGKADIMFKGYVMDDTEIKALKEKEMYDDFALIEEYLGVGLKDLKEEAISYFNPKKDLPKEEPKKGLDNPFKGTLKGFSEMFGPVAKIGSIFGSGDSKKESFLIEKLKDSASKETKELIFKVYNTYKKTHKMISW